MAHFLEHMIFKGTREILPGQFDRLVEGQGGITNAATSHDYAHFYVTTGVERLAPALSCLAQLLLRAEIPPNEFERERQVVLEEIRQADDDPDGWGFQQFIRGLYPHHAYGRPILGTADSLMNQSSRQMRHFHQTHYQPHNMIVVVVGGIEQSACVDLVSQSFQGFPVPPLPEAETSTQSPLAKLSPFSAQAPFSAQGLLSVQEFYLPQLEQARLMMGWVVPGIDEIEQAYGLDVLAAALAEGRSSILVQELREQRQLVQGISSSLSLQKESSFFSITAWLEPEYVPAVENLILTRLRNLHTNPIRPQALDRAKRLLVNDFVFSTETPGQMAGLYGYYHTIAHMDLGLVYPKEIAEISETDVMACTQQYLSPESYGITVLKPSRS
jgi:predicted Zn-dependent peptidase